MIYGNFDDNLKEPSMRYTGVAEAMLESAQSDLNMFKAMLALDAYEIKLNEAAEGETDKESLKQKMQKAGQAASGAVSRIRESIAKGLEKLADILYNAYGAIAVKIRQLLAKDMDLAAKGLKNVKPDNIKDLKIVWYKINKDPFKFTNYSAGVSKFAFEPDKEFKSQILEPNFFFDTDDKGSPKKEDVFAASKLAEIKNFFDKKTYGQAATFAKHAINVKRELRKTAADYRKKAKSASGEGAEKANEDYKAFKEYRNMRTKEVTAIQKAMATAIKMYRAALYKVLLGNRKNSSKNNENTNIKEESVIYDILVQEACYEVDKVMEGVIIGGDASELMGAKTEYKSSIQEHAELMEAMSAPIF